MLDAMEAFGITREYLARKLLEELEATEVKVFNDKEAGIVYSRELVSWGTRQKARMDAHRLRGDYPAEKREVTVPGLSGLVKTIMEDIDGDERGKLPLELEDEE